ncbi:hypothetical protein N6G94_04535 [Pediococcus inopinatus]|uniref:hypothetical protein n=1 Tax=Pediococcus inopinatus TaxID=114090 RepID=UPI002B26465E|nr:hypothetical protein [Pediococcus inopinatus]WPC18270.1 hypothetical protein N6G94_04535 [Pediococcus inopinatus]
MENLKVKANLQRGTEYVGGHLTIDDKGLYFHPHALNVQTEDLFVAADLLVSVDKGMTLGIVPNGVKVRTSTDEFFFVVSKRKNVLKTITDLIASVKK